MKKPACLLIGILIPFLGALICIMSSFSVSDESIAFTNVNVIPMDREIVLYNQTVLTENGKIIEIGNSDKIKVGSKFEVIDAHNRFLIPGLFDMHAHFFYEQGDNVNTCEAELKLMLVNGLTTVRIECGDPVYLEARESIAEKKIKGPRLFVASPQFVGKWPWPGKVFARICTTPEEAESAVQSCKKEGYDEIKITFMVKRDVYDAIIRTAREQKIKVTGHVGPLVKLPAALLARQQIEHMDEFIDMLLPDTSYNHGESVSDMNIWRKKAWETVPYLDERKIPALAASVKEAGIYVTPTNFFFFSSFADSLSEDQYKSRIDYEFIPQKIKAERWKIRQHYWKKAPPSSSRMRYIELRRKMTQALATAGVPLMAGSDSPEWFNVQGFSLHDELRTFSDCGLSNYQVLETATKNPASYLGVLDKKGTIAKGKDADLVLLDKNPLENISHTRGIAGVMIKGTWHDRTALEKLLKEAKQVLAQ